MVETILMIIAVYLLAGGLFVIPFLAKGLAKVDESAKGATTGFKIIIIPGVMVFWPLLLRKWIKRK